MITAFALALLIAIAVLIALYLCPFVANKLGASPGGLFETGENEASIEMRSAGGNK